MSDFRIWCEACGGESVAEHVHGPMPGRARTLRKSRAARHCFNRCRRCGAQYEAMRCGATQRRAQRQLERQGQLRLCN